MKNSLNKRIFLNILLLIGAVAATDIYAARPNAKRASRSKSSTPTKKKTSLSSSSETTTTVIESSENRSVSGTVTARPGRTNTVSATSSSAVDDDTAAELLASNLIACLQSPCYGDVAFEKCFANGTAESYTRANTTCLGMYNGVANDVIRVKAMNQVNAKIKSYFSDACSSAGGRVSGNTCKINVCYQAKGGSHETTRCMEYNVGKQVTCSYSAFGLSQQDLEYKEDMTSEQLGTIVQAGMQTLSGLLETGVAVVDAVQASKKLKKGSEVKGKECYGIYSYDTQKITYVGCVKDWAKCGGTGKKNDCDDKAKAVSDSAGNWYNVSDGKKSETESYTLTSLRTAAETAAETAAKAVNSTQTNFFDCNLAKNLGTDNKDLCLVKFDEWTEVAVQEQEASLYKKFTNFKKLQFEEKIDAMKQGAMYASLQQKVSKFGESSYKSCSTWVGEKRSYNEKSKSYETKSCFTLANIYNDTASKEDKVSSSECVEYQGSCMCKYVNKDGCNENVVKRENGYFKEIEFNYDTGEQNLNQSIDKLTNLMTNKDGSEKQTLSSATETFNSMQKKVNEKKQEITSLQEKKNSGIQKAISSGAQTLTTAGSTMTMAIVNANNNIGTMTGACYIGDPRAGGVYLMSENDVKKLSWKNL